MYKDYALNLIGSTLIAVFSFIFYKIILYGYGDSGLEFISLAKRYQSVIFPITMLGFGVLIPKLLAKNEISFRTIFKSIIFSTMFLIFIALFSYFINKNIFYSSIYTFPIILSAYIFSIYRGKFLFKKGIISNYIFLIVIPLLCYFVTSNLKSFIIVYSSISIFYFIFMMKDIGKLDFYKDKISFRSYFSNGAARAPGDVISQFIFLLPIFFLNNESSFSKGEYSLAISIVLAFSIPIKPISTILLVYIAKMEMSTFYLIKMIALYVFISLILTFSFLLLIPYINAFYFDSISFNSVLNSLVPLVFMTSLYIFLRSYIDSLYEMPLLSYLNIINVILFFVINLLLVDSILSLIASYSITLFFITLMILKKGSYV